MGTVEKVFLYGTLLLVLAALIASNPFERPGGSPSGVVQAQEPLKLMYEEAKLDVLRRNVEFAYRTFLSEDKRARDLNRSSADGDRQRATDAHGRSRNWASIEVSLRALFLCEVQSMLNEAKIMVTKTGQVIPVK